MSQTLQHSEQHTGQHTEQPTHLPPEIAAFYVHQMPLLEGRDFEAFVQTFTEDCFFGYEGAWQLRSRPALLEGVRANISRYGSSTIRHWFENRRAEPQPDGATRVTATCLVSVTDENGDVTFEPSCVVTDELVRTAEGLRARSRVIRHDVPDPGRYYARLAAQHS
ncbi:nuclear transport factor 2 family protein [Streptomyces sp. ID05-04B]|uniref:nuclear transport factor 2 family protein n=1 Tax=unclassified Streptomyces TaxID=2593676 RepID=UPI000D1A680F|nr:MULTISPECIES: nuclear transport factor 2 family protein [unclassified Streptomyces]AVV41283.1 nuclear transport factor 2 family protein [Streptomyces sp. P3]MDX5565760.1 nuclear transport factor 2 family protein [Streptomyces sp. ID05-04B]